MENGIPLPWDEVKHLAGSAFNVWTFGSELDWAEHAWSALGSSGLTEYHTELERTECILRLYALAAIYQEFCARAYGTPSVGDWTEEQTSNIFDAKLDEFTAGQLVGCSKIGAVKDPDEEGIPSEVFPELIDKQSNTIVKALREHWGISYLYASLYASPNLDTIYPLDEEAVDEIVNFDLTADKLVAWEWLTEGCPLF